MPKDKTREELEAENERLRQELKAAREARHICPNCGGKGYIAIFPERWSGTCGVCLGSGKI